MPDKKADTAIAHQVELAIGRLDSLSILPCVAAQLLPRLMQGQFSPSADIIESDPALTARILSLMGKYGVSKAGERFSLRQGLDRLPAGLVRDALLSLRVIHEPQHDNRKQLMLHSLAVACCAKDIAEITLPQMDSQLAYCAGLLHDIGKFALEEAMPKSFVRIIEEAKSQCACTCDIEKKYLGTDHTMLGKHLAQKWYLPEAIGLAIWLHHSDTVTIYQNMSEARMAAIVQLADSIARQSGIGQSGSFDSPAQITPIVNVLGIDNEQLKPIRQNLAKQVWQRAKVLGLDMQNAVARYADAAGAIAAQSARDYTMLADENRRLQTISGRFDFITEFLLSINSASGAIDIAENFATRWQKFYQTGMVCLYLAPADNSKTLEAVIVQELGQSKTMILGVPEDSAAIPKKITSSFAILDAHDCLDWLFEQLDVDFDVSRTKLVPLLSNGKAIGAIAFELNWPVDDAELFAKNFKAVTSIAGAVLEMDVALQKQECFAERFAQLISKPLVSAEVSRSGITTDYLFSALAEMAAGAAHELNNPLSVISGRAQTLAETETDEERKRIIGQIERNAGQIAQIVEDLMSFAEPPKPRPAKTTIKQILNEAVQLAGQKTKDENVNTQIEAAEPDGTILVDSGQLVSALANIIVNAVESYDDKPGPIKITAALADSGLVKLTISDLGCGMDTETLQKATQPFFSAKTAGRNRGMGLAYAARLIQLNGGSLHIASKPGEGTTVTILLPREQKRNLD
jgi:putative nucleotidyltransferase with HDIG domain